MTRLLASFREWSWGGFILQLSLIFAPSLIAALWGVRYSSSGTRGPIFLMSSLAGIVLTIITFCGWPKKLDWGLGVIVIPILLGTACAYGLARLLAR